VTMKTPTLRSSRIPVRLTRIVATRWETVGA
jgi:hypothetical protein